MRRLSKKGLWLQREKLLPFIDSEDLTEVKVSNYLKNNLTYSPIAYDPLIYKKTVLELRGFHV